MRTIDELQLAMRDQVKFIATSCLAFDNGHEAEAARIATAIIVLVHDSGNNESILTQLGLKGSMGFFSTAWTHPPGARGLWTPLARMRVEAAAPHRSKHVPRFDNGPKVAIRNLNFDEWWNETVIVHAQEPSRSLSRGALLRTWRNQDGGSHYDSALTNEAYKAAKRGEGRRFVLGGHVIDLPGLLNATVRQIAYEVELSIQFQATRVMGPTQPSVSP